MSEEAVRAAFASQAQWCTVFGSPFTASVARVAGQRLDRSTPLGCRILDWPGDPAPEADNLPARFCAGFHFLVRTGAAPGLTPLYPPNPLPEEDGLWRCLEPLLEQHAAVLDGFLDTAPQTNEVGRSAALMAGLLEAAAAFPLPIVLLELGSSGGLNLILDRYFYDLGGRAAGAAGSPLLLAPEWTGPPPPPSRVRIASRRGADIAPRCAVRDGERLLAYVWADQRDRMRRLETALAIAAADPPSIDRADAGEWLEAELPSAPAEGHLRLVMHSLAFQYFPAATQERIRRLMEDTGRDATDARPLGWLRVEQLPGEELASIRLRLWPGGADRLLGWAQAHGRSIEWLG